MSFESSSELRAGALVERLRESLAFACVTGLVVGMVLGVVLGGIDGPALISADTAQQFTVTSTVLSSVMTVIGVVLSVLVLAQQLASQQYSPRAIRTTLRDRPTLLAFGALFGYVGFMIGVLEGINDQIENPLGVAIGLFLSVGALGLVAYLIQHVTNGFRSDQLVARIAADTLAAVGRIAERDDTDQQRNARAHGLDDIPDGAMVLHASTSGYLQDVAVDSLAQSMADIGGVVRLGVGVGDFVGARTGLGWAWSKNGTGKLDTATIEDIVNDHLRFGSTRTTQREVGSGIQQLVDIAMKALSPAVNDPYTAVQAVNTVTFVLQRMAERRQDWLVGVVDDDLIVTIPRPLVWDFVDQTVSWIRPVAGRYPVVLRALVMLLRTVVATRPNDVERIRPHLQAIHDEAETAELLPIDLERVDKMVHLALQECGAHHADTPPESDESDPDGPDPDQDPDQDQSESR